ncbi:hypothetical protein HMPREF0083_03863 [Aneurinibacillus aneurinilyticus ATCC 12856]|uniref:Uncharacterized protein n=1 Tax=Aneurinibacillus aneurinilyticus ATCC 12856 TaxID=649747 RepID=U1WZC5_ANEAE|nr:hypothetical protein HMPREF0083_03863 [Aneurinibacillus aneurinilyticus ATCC 12856]
MRVSRRQSFDYIVAGEVGLSERTYTKIKAGALYLHVLTFEDSC